jgi:hypothetical protein
MERWLSKQKGSSGLQGTEIFDGRTILCNNFQCLVDRRFFSATGNSLANLGRTLAGRCRIVGRRSTKKACLDAIRIYLFQAAQNTAVNSSTLELSVNGLRVFEARRRQAVGVQRTREARVVPRPAQAISPLVPIKRCVAWPRSNPIC